MPIVSLPQHSPKIDPTAWIAPTASVIGDVVLGAGCGVWYGAVLRGDVNSIRIGARTNVQDLCVIHVTPQTGPCTVGDDVTIGHQAVLHGCDVRHRVLIGMGAVILDNAVIGSDSLVAAGAVVPARMQVPAGVLVMGAPARVKRELTEREKRDILQSAMHYCELLGIYR